MKIIGNGGHAKVIREVIKACGLPESEKSAFVAIGDNATRKKVVEVELAGQDLVFLTLIHPSAVVSDSATIGEGSIIMAGAVVQAEAKIGRHCIVNTGATVDHDCMIGDYVHIAPGVHLCGGVKVGAGALLGVGSAATPMAEIKAWSLLKAGRVATAVKLEDEVQMAVNEILDRAAGQLEQLGSLRPETAAAWLRSLRNAS